MEFGETEYPSLVRFPQIAWSEGPQTPHGDVAVRVAGCRSVNKFPSIRETLGARTDSPAVQGAAVLAEQEARYWRSMGAQDVSRSERVCCRVGRDRVRSDGGAARSGHLAPWESGAANRQSQLYLSRFLWPQINSIECGV